MSNSLSSVLGNYALSAKLGAMKSSDVAHAVDAFVNWVGCSIGGARTTSVDAAVRGYNSVLSEGRYKILGRPERFNLFEAVFMDCLASAVLSFDDTHLETILHPTGPIAAALIGLARTQKVSGEEYIAAQIVGMEVQCRAALTFASAGTGSNRSWFSTGLTGGVGAAAGVGRLLGFDEATMANAFGLAAASGCGNRGTHGSMARASVRAYAGENGFKAAILAKGGFTCGTRALDGTGGMIDLIAPKPAWEHALKGLGTVSESARTTFKPYPTGFIVHPIIDAMLSLVKDHGVKADDVQELRLKVSKATLGLGNNKHPRDTLHCQVSIHYWTAAVLATGRAGMEQLDESMINDPVIGKLQDRVHPEESADIRDDQCVAIAKLTDGRTVEVEIKHATGSVDKPMTSKEIDAKFMAQSGNLNSKERAEKLLKMCRNVLELDDVSKILDV